MKRLLGLLSLILLVSILCACGGDGDGNEPTQSPTLVITPIQSPTPVVTPTLSPTPLITPTQLPMLNVKVLSDSILRMVASGTSIVVDVLVQPVSTLDSTLYATATDKTGVFMPTVSVTANNDGTYKLVLTTSTMATTGYHTGTVTLSFFSDSACTIPQHLPTIAVSFDINVISSSSWLGNHLSPLNAWPGIPDWTMFQGNAAHTGYVPVIVNPNLFSTRWEMPLVMLYGLTHWYDLIAAPVTSAGQFFVVGADKVLVARNEFDGSTVWQYDFKVLGFGASVTPPAIADGIVYIVAGQMSSSFLFAFNANNGSLIFKVPMVFQWQDYLAPTIGTQGIYTNAAGGHLFAFDRNGHQLFSIQVKSASLCTPAIDAAGVYTYAPGVLQMIDPQSGAVINTIIDPNYKDYGSIVGGSPVLGLAGSVFISDCKNSGPNGNNLTNFNLNKNAIAWQIPGAYPSTPAYADGILYTVNEKPLCLEARVESDGALMWSWVPPLPGDVNFQSEVLLTKNMAFVSTNLVTYAIDITTHRAVWSYPLSGHLSLSQNGILYIQGEKSLVAVNLK